MRENCIKMWKKILDRHNFPFNFFMTYFSLAKFLSIQSILVSIFCWKKHSFCLAWMYWKRRARNERPLLSPWHVWRWLISTQTSSGPWDTCRISHPSDCFFCNQWLEKSNKRLAGIQSSTMTLLSTQMMNGRWKRLLKWLIVVESNLGSDVI